MKTVNDIIEFYVQQAMFEAMVYDSEVVLDEEKVRKQFYDIIPDNLYKLRVKLVEIDE